MVAGRRVSVVADWCAADATEEQAAQIRERLVVALEQTGLPLKITTYIEENPPVDEVDG